MNNLIWYYVNPTTLKIKKNLYEQNKIENKHFEKETNPLELLLLLSLLLLLLSLLLLFSVSVKEKVLAVSVIPFIKATLNLWIPEVTPSLLTCKT